MSKPHEQIANAIAALPILPDRRGLVEEAINTLTIMAGSGGPIGNLRNWRQVGRPAVERELRALASLLDGEGERLAKNTRSLSGTAIDLLADCGWFRGKDVDRARRAARCALERIRDGQWVAPKPERGRPPKPRDDGITAVAAHYYEELTEREPRRSSFDQAREQAGKPTGPLYRFVKAVFLAASIRTDPRAAIERHMKRVLPCPVDWKQCGWRQIDGEWHFLPDGHERESSIARVYRVDTEYWARWCVQITGMIHLPRSAAFSAAEDARRWVEQQFADDDQCRSALEAGIRQQ